MFQKLSEKIDAESFVYTFLQENEPTVTIVMNDVAYEKIDMDVLVDTLKELADKHNLGLDLKVHPKDDRKYFVMLKLEKA